MAACRTIRNTGPFSTKAMYFGQKLSHHWPCTIFLQSFSDRQLPLTSRNFAKRTLGERAVSKLGRVAHWVFYEPNPIIVIFYLVLVIGGYIIFVKDAFEHIPNQFLSHYHIYGAHIATFITLSIFVWTWQADPGVVRLSCPDSRPVSLSSTLES